MSCTSKDHDKVNFKRVRTMSLETEQRPTQHYTICNHHGCFVLPDYEMLKARRLAKGIKTFTSVVE